VVSKRYFPVPLPLVGECCDVNGVGGVSSLVLMPPLSLLVLMLGVLTVLGYLLHFLLLRHCPRYVPLMGFGTVCSLSSNFLQVA
jgi:hypothetical protein